MTDWEKIRAGIMYNDFADELFARRVTAKKLFRAYNRTEDDEVEKRQQILCELLESVGKNVWIEPDFRCEFGKNITIGDDVYINFGWTAPGLRSATMRCSVRISASIRSITRSTQRSGSKAGAPAHRFTSANACGWAGTSKSSPG